MSGFALSSWKYALTALVSWPASGCASNDGFEYIATMPPVLTSSSTTDPRWQPELLLREPLQRGVHRQDDAPGVVVAREDVLQVLELEVGGAADELVVVGLLDAGVADDERLVADDLADQRSERVLALVLEVGVVRRRDRLGCDLAVGGDDLARGDG